MLCANEKIGAKMKTAKFTFVIIIILSSAIYSQSFNKVWEYKINGVGEIYYIGDINKDNKGEFLVDKALYSSQDTVIIMDYNKNILYNLPNVDLDGSTYPEKPNKLFDFNNDGVADLFIRTGTGIAIYDMKNNAYLFSLNVMAYPGQASISVATIADIDRDGNLEILFSEEKYGGAELYSIYYLYKTSASISSAISPDNDIPSSFGLHQNYPNPFNPTTTIEYTLPSNGNGKIEIFDSVGRLVKSYDTESKSAGTYKINFDSRDSNGISLASGVYYYRLVFGGKAEAKKMLLLK